jgi:hypothetical protein
MVTRRDLRRLRVLRSAVPMDFKLASMFSQRYDSCGNIRAQPFGGNTPNFSYNCHKKQQRSYDPHNLLSQVDQENRSAAINSMVYLLYPATPTDPMSGCERRPAEGMRR